MFLPAILAAGLLLGSVRAQEVAPVPLKVMTFNLRYNNPEDGPNAWPHRQEMVAAVFTEQAVDFAGLQEVLAGMIGDLQRLLPQYAFIGVGREDGKQKGEYAPIFYRRDKFVCEKQGTFWLSPTPEEVGSKGWDAALARIATWGVFRDKGSNREFFFMNTHFDHRGDEARRQSAKLLIERCAALGKGLPVVLSGDFNSTAEMSAIRTLVSDGRLKLTNTEAVSHTPHTGGAVSFNDFGKTTEGEVIDYIFVGPGIDVASHAFLPIIKDGVYVSDHWPAVSEIVVK